MVSSQVECHCGILNLELIIEPHADREATDGPKFQNSPDRYMSVKWDCHLLKTGENGLPNWGRIMTPLSQ